MSNVNRRSFLQLGAAAGLASGLPASLASDTSSNTPENSMENNSVSIDLGDEKGRVEGICSDRFQPVLDAFVKNFQEQGEVGASVALTHEGETVVDLWGGVVSEDTRQPWQSDTISLVFSATKGVTALIANVLIDRGLLDPWQPVAEIWPEFATNGKEKATVRMMLDHTVGVPAVREKIKPGGYLDWDYMCDLLARQEPFWEPGSRQGYHGVTFAWTAGELIRRATGKSVGANIQEILSVPLGLDLWCGLPEEFEPRVALMIPVPFTVQATPMMLMAEEDPQSIPGLFLSNDGGWTNGFQLDPKTGRMPADSRASHAAEIPSANGITNARGLAGAYLPFALGGSVNGRKFVGAETLIGMEEISAATNLDATQLGRGAYSLGFMKRMDGRKSQSDQMVGLHVGRRAFGHLGAGGSHGFADPEAGISFGYTMNKMGKSTPSDCLRTLVNAVYPSLGYKADQSGYWVS